MKTGFLLLLQTIYKLASCVHITTAIGAFYHDWKWHNVQRARSEMRRCTTHALYRSKLWQPDNCQHPQNTNRWIARNNRDVPRVMKTKFPVTVIFFSVVSSEGHIMPPHIFEVGLKVNSKVYLDVLKSVVIRWCNQMAGDRHLVWQQESALAHKSKETQAWLQKECYDFVPFSHWTPFPPDLNPLDYFELPPALAPSSGSVSRHWLRLKVATLNRCQLYYIIKLPELIFSTKVLK